jgi:hypothetical protein
MNSPAAADPSQREPATPAPAVRAAPHDRHAARGRLHLQRGAVRQRDRGAHRARRARCNRLQRTSLGKLILTK